LSAQPGGGGGGGKEFLGFPISLGGGPRRFADIV